MPTKSYARFLKNIETVDRLKGTYELIRTQRGGRGRAAFDHVTRSAIIFLASAFEVYVEDVLLECCNQHISFARDAKKLPHAIRSTISEYVKKESNGVSPTDLCDEGWRDVYKKITRERTDRLNTPKKRQLMDLFTNLIGINEMDINNLERIGGLDDFISFRGELAHRVRADIYVRIDKVNEEEEDIKRLVKSMDRLVLRYFRESYEDQRLPWNEVY